LCFGSEPAKSHNITLQSFLHPLGRQTTTKNCALPRNPMCSPFSGYFWARFSVWGGSFGHFGWSILKNCCCRKNPFGYCLSYFGRQPVPSLFLPFLFSSFGGFLINDLCVYTAGLTAFHVRMCVSAECSSRKPLSPPMLSVFPPLSAIFSLFVLLTSPAACRLRKSLLKIITMLFATTNSLPPSPHYEVFVKFKEGLI